MSIENTEQNDLKLGDEVSDSKEQLLEELTQWQDRAMRLQAELKNQSRRFERQLSDEQRYAVENFARELLPVKDSLELGLSSVRKEEDFKKLRKGTEFTLELIKAAMEKFGIYEIDPLGEEFNPQYHDAMSVQPVSEVAPNKILAVHQKGYRIGEHLLRPARVIVSTQVTSKQK